MRAHIGFNRHKTRMTHRHMTAEPLCISLLISLIVVIEMKKVTPHKRGSIVRRVLRFLTMSSSVEELRTCQEITHVPLPTDNSYTDRKEINAALLEAERKKAEALMERQKRALIC